MGEPEAEVLHASDRSVQEQPPSWLFLPWVLGATAGIWAIDRYAGHGLGAWRFIPEGVLGFYALFCLVVGVLMLVSEASLRLTDRHLEVRRPWGRRRWAWSELRDIRIIDVYRPPLSAVDGPDGTTGFLALIPEHAPAVPLPKPFQDSNPVQMGQLAERLVAALHQHHPTAEPLDAAALDVAGQNLSERLQVRDRHRAWRGKYWSLAFVVIAGAGLVLYVTRVIRALADGQPWLRATTGVLLSVLILVQVAQTKGYVRRLPKPLQRVFGIVFALAWTALLLLIQNVS